MEKWCPEVEVVGKLFYAVLTVTLHQELPRSAPEKPRRRRARAGLSPLPPSLAPDPLHLRTNYHAGDPTVSPLTS